MSDFEPLARLLQAVEAASPVDAVRALTSEVGARLHASSVSFLVADMSGRALVRLVHLQPIASGDLDDRRLETGERQYGDESATVLPFDGGRVEGVVREQRVAVLPPEESSHGEWSVFAPVTERGEVIGVLELRLPAAPDANDVAEISALAHLLAFVVIANERHTDLFEWGHRTRSLSLSAEIQQRVLPGPRTCEAGAFTLSGWLEPASSIAGDTFDYSLERDTLHLSVTDAMGHGVSAALTATLCVAALRGARRRESDLVGAAASANDAVADHITRGGREDFVTGLVGRLDLPTGVLRLVNAGHVAPYLARGGTVRSLELPPNLPFGMFADTVYDQVELTLQPGDRVVFVTDGMLERNAASIDMGAAILESVALHPREAAAALADSVVQATGHALSDDATVLCLDWHGDHGRQRATTAGADRPRVDTR